MTRHGSSMRIKAIQSFVVLVGLLAVSIPLVAHHGNASYDNKVVTLKGTVTEWRWINPHVFLKVDVKGDDGKVVNWALETGSANALIRRGWKKTDLPAGTVLVVDGWQARNGSATANVSSVTFTDGKRLFAGSSNESSETK